MLRINIYVRFMGAYSANIYFPNVSVCGFSDQPHFTRTFKQFKGQTPKAWRKVHLPD